MQKLSFEEEAKGYLDRLDTLRSSEELKLIRQYADQIKMDNVDTYAAVAAHIKEPGIYETLRAYGRSSLPEEHLIVVYFNGNNTVLDSEYTTLLQNRVAETARAQSEFPFLNVQVFSHCFPTWVPLGKVRGLIADALVLKASEKHIAEPLLISNDADALAYDHHYFQNMRAAFRQHEFIDYVSGPISWGGFDKEGSICYEPRVTLPELYLIDWVSAVADDLYRALGYVFTTGCNSAFRMSSLCAINGYDYHKVPDFDVEIGYAFNAYRRNNNGARTASEYGRFIPGCHLATSPRRTLYALLSDIPIGRQFETCGTIPGPELSLFEYIDAYLKRDDVIQAQDMIKYATGAAVEVEKCCRRMTELFVLFLNGEHYDDKMSLARAVAFHVGLSIADIQMDGTKVRSLAFDWSNSTALQVLADWVVRTEKGIASRAR